MITQIDILIADDEAPARQKLRTFLSKEPEVGKIFEAEDGDQTVDQIRKENPALVFLDIQMPGLNGFEVIETIGINQMPVIVFVTAYDEYALKAFEVHAIDYLLKPYDRIRFRRAFHHAMEALPLKHSQNKLLENLMHSTKSFVGYPDRLMVNIGNRIIPVPVEEIYYVQADDKYVEIHTSEKKYLLRDSLSDLEAKLDPAHFTRIHRSHLVRIDAIRQMTPRSHGDYVVELLNGHKLILSRRYRDNLFR